MPTFPRNLLTLRFSLRAMLVVVTIGCVTLGWRANRLYQNQRAIDSLKSSHLRVSILTQMQFGMAKLSFFQHIDVAKAELAPEVFKGETSVEFPSLWVDLANLKPLTTLSLSNVYLPLRSLARISQNKMSVTDVELVDCEIHGDALAVAIEQMPRLKVLTITGGSFDSRNLSCLAKCQELERLSFRGSTIGPGIISTLPMKKLQRLDLCMLEPNYRIELSDDDLNVITQMEHLQFLTIRSHSGFPLKGLPSLKKCKNLASLTVDLKDVSEADYATIKADLQTALPKCQVRLYAFRGQPQ